MKPVLLTDFGSTYTKLTAVDVDTARVLGTAAAYTTVQTDVNDGFSDALRQLEEKTGRLEYAERYACSSAAGGLRMIVSGLVPELTLEAARMASLGAGAKLIGQFSFELTEDDIDQIRREKPDIFLLVGGTQTCWPPCGRIFRSSSRATARLRGNASGSSPDAACGYVKMSCRSLACSKRSRRRPRSAKFF